MLEHQINRFTDSFEKDKYSGFVLGVDVGGTNTNFCIAGVKEKKPDMIFSFDFKTKNLESLIPAINQVLEYAKESFDIQIDYACIGAAGVVSPDKSYANLTNVSWNVDLKEVLNKTNLKKTFIINDFKAIAYGINLLEKKDLLEIRPGNNIDDSKSTKVVIGAGTGLGKSIIVFDEKINGFVPLASEGGHGDLPIHNDFELKLADFIKKTKGATEPVCYEEVLSGRGLVNIFNFLKSENISQNPLVFDEIENSFEKPVIISKYKSKDETCKKTFELFTRFYGRCAKSFVLDTMATGGLYIAGGISLKNQDIFSTNNFFEEFNSAEHRSDILRKIPIYLIKNPHVGLLGVCFVAMCKLQGRL